MGNMGERVEMSIRIVVLVLVFTTSLFSNVLDHLKPVEAKSNANRMKNVDFIYMINLDQRPEKFKKSQEMLDVYQVYSYRFSAVNGWELTLSDIHDLGVPFRKGVLKRVMSTCYPSDQNFEPVHEFPWREGEAYFCHCMSRGAIGCVLSHLSILKDAYDSGYETIWVMEDDIDVKKDPQLVSALIDELDRTVGSREWDILFTDRDTKSNNGGVHTPCNGFSKRINFPDKKRGPKTKKINNTFRKIEARYGAYSMIVRRSGMKKILDFYEKYHIYLPYDMDIFLISNMNHYTVLDEVVTTRIAAESDNGGPNYLNPTFLVVCFKSFIKNF